MVALTPLLAPLAVLAADPTVAAPVQKWSMLVAEASHRFGVPEAWIKHVIRAESAGRTMLGDAPIRSRKGAIGLMQLMPRTWIEMREQLGLGADPDDPRDNILAGTAYLKMMYDRFGYPGLFAAYNAGPARYSAYRTGLQALPRETVAYVRAITRARLDHDHPIPSTPPAIFVVVQRDRKATNPQVQTRAPSSLFAIEN